jgi:hypothetical protein
MVTASDLFILTLAGGALYIAFIFRDKLPFVSSSSKDDKPIGKLNGNGTSNGVNGNGQPKFTGDPRDFVAKMKFGVSRLILFLRSRLHHTSLWASSAAELVELDSLEMLESGG